MQDEAEQELVERAKTDAQAFGVLYDRYYLKILTYILRRVGDVSLAEDLTTNTFMKGLERLHRFTWRGLPFSAWLYRIASNEIADHFRGRHTKDVSLEMLMEAYGFEPAGDTDIEAEHAKAQEEITRHELYMRVRQILLTLPPKYQEVLSLRYFEKKSIAEISQIMRKRPGTVKSLLSRGTRKLREALPPA